MPSEALTGATANHQDGARLDIAASGFWGGTYERTLLDVRVFNPHAPSNRQPSIASCYRRHEQTKKRAYEQRCREVEHASFTPLVMSATGGLAKEATIFYKRLASMLASRPLLQQHTVLATLPTELFAAPLIHPGPQGITIFHRSSRQGTRCCRPRQH